MSRGVCPTNFVMVFGPRGLLVTDAISNTFQAHAVQRSLAHGCVIACIFPTKQKEEELSVRPPLMLFFFLEFTGFKSNLRAWFDRVITRASYLPGSIFVTVSYEPFSMDFMQVASHYAEAALDQPQGTSGKDSSQYRGVRTPRPRVTRPLLGPAKR